MSAKDSTVYLGSVQHMVLDCLAKKPHGPWRLSTVLQIPRGDLTAPLKGLYLRNLIRKTRADPVLWALTHQGQEVLDRRDGDTPHEERLTPLAHAHNQLHVIREKAWDTEDAGEFALWVREYLGPKRKTGAT